MTDLERKRRPSDLVRRSVAVTAVAGVVVAAFALGRLGTDPSSDDRAATTPVAFFGELEAADSCDDLLRHYVDPGVDLIGAYGWQGPVYRDLVGSAVDGVAELDAASAPATSEAKVTRSTSSETGTNVQEAGVDEPDSVKTDGTLFVRLRGSLLMSYDVSGDEVEPLGDLDLGDFKDGEILLARDTVVAIGNDGSRDAQTRVLTIDVADPDTPTLVRTVDYDAATVTARQHGDAVRLVLSGGLPELDFVQPGDGTSEQAALRTNRALVEDSDITDWLPTVAIDGGEAEPLLACDRVALPRADVALGTMAVIGFDSGADLSGAADLDSFGLAGDASLAYESTDHLYLATSTAGFVPFGGPGSFNDCGFTDFCISPPFPRATGDGTTPVYDFALDGTSATYVGAGEVEGTIRDRWAMDEHDGVLRVAVGPSSETGNFNSVVTLEGKDDALVEIGRVDRLGVGEEIKSVRWFDDLAIVVTFRQIDPLYAIDLTAQDDPELIGQLKIPGFSSYLHPLGSQRLVGIGEGPQAGRNRWGAQAGLFDVSDLTDPRQIDVLSYGAGSRALAGGDPRQFTWLPSERTLLTVIQNGRGGFVSAVEVSNGELINTMTQVEFGSDVDEVRAVPLYGAGPDGGDKVVLVTGEDVEFFDVG
ncbi:beta-propeller domain-containing protein [Nocardioides sp.]|uniref:beta-propeller domain-containing protein n=1 Tax=Nocardioides sp. TaxID=35761 RepID=UPI002B268565|nr:beta-propeller domain-containing protein [Nocardioides sp.]